MENLFLSIRSKAFIFWQLNLSMIRAEKLTVVGSHKIAGCCSNAVI